MKWKAETIALHGGQAADPTTKSRAVPIYQTTSFVFTDCQHAASLFALQPPVWQDRILEQNTDKGHSPGQTGNIYTRIMNPTTDVLEKRMALLEKGIGALATSSGAAAITYALLTICSQNDHIVASRNLYGGTYNLLSHTLPRYGIKSTLVDCRDLDAFAQAITIRTKCIFVESMGNPGLDVPDLAALADLAHDRGIPLLVDNTLPSPYLCQPFLYGADIIVHSLTKFCGGHGTSIGGIIIDRGRFDWSQNEKFPSLNQADPSYHGLCWSEALGEKAYILKARSTLLRDTGACISPFNSFLILQGLETLPLRMQKHSENALAVARFLQEHPKVAWVNYPGLSSHPSHALAKRYLKNGFGAMVGFGIKGGLAAGQRFIEHLQLFSHLANIGDAKSLAIQPASTTHAQLTPEERIKAGVSDDFIRLSVGLEHIDDILADLENALRQ